MSLWVAKSIKHCMVEDDMACMAATQSCIWTTNCFSTSSAAPGCSSESIRKSMNDGGSSKEWPPFAFLFRRVSRIMSRPSSHFFLKSAHPGNQVYTNGLRGVDHSRSPFVHSMARLM